VPFENLAQHLKLFVYGSGGSALSLAPGLVPSYLTTVNVAEKHRTKRRSQMATDGHTVDVLGALGQVRLRLFEPLSRSTFEPWRQGPPLDAIPLVHQFAAALAFCLAGYGLTAGSG
jgi:hypothetical protein